MLCLSQEVDMSLNRDAWPRFAHRSAMQHSTGVAGSISGLLPMQEHACQCFVAFHSRAGSAIRFEVPSLKCLLLSVGEILKILRPVCGVTLAA